jgi:hypothetical protein
MPCSPRMERCSVSCAHFQLVESYRAERERQLSASEELAAGYATELAEYRPGLVTFRTYLRHTAGRRA